MTLAMRTTGVPWSLLVPVAWLAALGLGAPGKATARAQGGEARAGLAARYPGDVGLGNDPAVILFYDYEHPSSWRSGWGGNMKLYAHTTEPESVYAGRGALEATLKEGNTGNGGHYRLKRPETCLYQRVYLKFPDGYDHGPGMKFHGFAGTGPGRPLWYPQGTAGKRPDGTDKLYGIMCLGNSPGCYYYHPHQRGGYGDGGRFGPRFELGKWHCFEMMLKVNDVGAKNGELAFWLDGERLKHVTGLEWRTSEELSINLVLDHTYYNNGPPKDQSLFLDNRVVARKYIGPMVRRPPRGVRSGIVRRESVWKLIAEKEKARRESRVAGTTSWTRLRRARSSFPGRRLPESERRKPKEGALAAFDARLIRRVREETGAGKRPEFFLRVARGPVRAVSATEAGDLKVDVVRGGHGPLLMLRQGWTKSTGAELDVKWQRLSISDRRSLALAVLREGVPADHCLAAFYLIADGDEGGAKEHLDKGAGGAAEVEASFSLYVGGHSPLLMLRQGRTKSARRTPAAVRLSSPKSEVAGQVPTDLLTLYKEAETCFIDGDLAKAKELFKRIADDHPETGYAGRAREYLKAIE